MRRVPRPDVTGPGWRTCRTPDRSPPVGAATWSGSCARTVTRCSDGLPSSPPWCAPGRRCAAPAARDGTDRGASSCSTGCSGCEPCRASPGLLRDGPDAGVHFLCLDTEGTRLPVECGAVVQVSPGPRSRITLAVNGAGTVDDVVPDAVSDRWAHRFARALARLRDATPDEDEAEVPDAARLLDLLAPAGLTPHDVARRWRDRPRSTSALLGVAAAGPCAVDLRRDGPHALVGGTTGAGKSELLQTMIASLAMGNRPDEMAFVLVDYKGGSAFKDCARLPHTVGLVTDLDGHLTARALASLEAELTRREHLLGRRRRQGHRGLPGGRRPGRPTPAPPGPGDRRVQDAGRGAARLPRRARQDRRRRPLARHPPRPGHPASRWHRVGRHQGQRQPADRPACPRHGRLRGRHRRPCRAGDPGADTRARLPPLRGPAARRLPDRPRRRTRRATRWRPGHRPRARLGDARRPAATRAGPLDLHRPDRPRRRRRGHHRGREAPGHRPRRLALAAPAPRPGRRRHARGAGVAGAVRAGRPAAPAGPAAGDLGPGARRPPGRGRRQPDRADVLPADAGLARSRRGSPPRTSTSTGSTARPGRCRR